MEVRPRRRSLRRGFCWIDPAAKFLETLRYDPSRRRIRQTPPRRPVFPPPRPFVTGLREPAVPNTPLPGVEPRDAQVPAFRRDAARLKCPFRIGIRPGTPAFSIDARSET